MELSFAFLASMADHLADGRMVVIGPEFEALECAQFPTAVPVSIVVKMLVDPLEAGQRHAVRIEYQTPDGTRRPLGTEADLETKGNDVYPDRKSGASLIINTGIVAAVAGDYLFHVIVDEREIKALPLTLLYDGEQAIWDEIDRTSLTDSQLSELSQHFQSRNS